MSARVLSPQRAWSGHWLRPTTAEEELEMAALITYDRSTDTPGMGDAGDDCQEVVFYFSKAFLSDACSFFANAFSGEWKESTGQSEKTDGLEAASSNDAWPTKDQRGPFKGPTLRLPAESPLTLHHVLCYIHPTYQAELTIASVGPLWNFADMTGLNQLKWDCEVHWKSYAWHDPVSAFTAAETYPVSAMYELYSISGSCLLREPQWCWDNLSDEGKAKLNEHGRRFRILVAYLALVETAGRMLGTCWSCHQPLSLDCDQIKATLSAARKAEFCRYKIRSQILDKNHHCKESNARRLLIETVDLRRDHQCPPLFDGIQATLEAAYEWTLTVMEGQSEFDVEMKEDIEAVYRESQRQDRLDSSVPHTVGPAWPLYEATRYPWDTTDE